ncbi:MAG: TMEM165/GDT1 family protein [Asticcacaulis sp.]
MPHFFDAFFNSTLLVALSEIGDKTQILALILAARYRKSVPIIWGIFIATLANHALAAWAGHFISGLGFTDYLPWLVAVAFIVLGLWILIPDKVDDDETPKRDFGPFLTTLVAFFLAEMGDKTQIATVFLGAKYDALFAVIIGTTIGMMIANVPAVLFGDKLLSRIPMQWVRYAASVMFIGFGLFGLFQLIF